MSLVSFWYIILFVFVESFRCYEVVIFGGRDLFLEDSSDFSCELRHRIISCYFQGQLGGSTTFPLRLLCPFTTIKFYFCFWILLTSTEIKEKKNCSEDSISGIWHILGRVRKCSGSERKKTDKISATKKNL